MSAGTLVVILAYADVVSQLTHLRKGALFLPAPEPLPAPFAQIPLRVEIFSGQGVDLKATVLQIIANQGMIAVSFDDLAAAKAKLDPLFESATEGQGEATFVFWRQDEPSVKPPPRPSAMPPPAAARASYRPPSNVPAPDAANPRGTQPDIERSKAALASKLMSGLRSLTPAGQFRPAMATPGGQIRLPSAPLTLTGLDPRALADLLRRRYDEGKTPSRPVSTHALLAEAAFARGDYPEAARLFAAAIQNPPVSAADLKAAKERDEAAAIEKAKAAEQGQDFATAAVAWARAFDAVANAESAHHATLCFRKLGNDPRRAVKYGEESVKLDPNKAAYRMALALAYADAGLGVRANGEIERAMALEPKNQRIKEAAAKIRGG